MQQPSYELDMPRKQDIGLWKQDFQTVALLSSKSGRPHCLNKQHASAATQPSGSSSSKCIVSKCRDNPNCINYLGQNILLEQFSTTDAYSNSMFHPRDLNKMPAGLKNHGATCYLNSLLQAWFYTPDINSTIMKHAFHAHKNSALYELGLVLAQLELSEKPCISPERLIDIMKIDPSLQQDALEFEKLFVSVVDLEIASLYTGSDSIMHLNDLMKGEHSYVTCCKNCQSKSSRQGSFHELALDITSCLTLLDCVNDYLFSELLQGDNQYMCSTCNSKQDASRHIQLHSLPKILNFQITRFRFDPKTLLKEKIHEKIEFPEWIDMSPFLVTAAQGSAIYELKSVLLHKGFSANSGHYVQRLYSQKYDKWLNLDDETVSIMPFPSFELDGSKGISSKSTKTANGKLEKTAAKSKVFVNISLKKQSLKNSNITEKSTAVTKQAQQATLTFSSSSAYQLTYVLSSKRLVDGNLVFPEETAVDSKKDAHMIIPKDMKTEIDLDNRDFHHQFETQITNKEMTVNILEAENVAWKQIFSTWHTMDEKTPFVYIMTKNLAELLKKRAAWIANLRKSLYVLDDKKNSEDEIAPLNTDIAEQSDNLWSISNHDLLCAHSKLHPVKLWMTKKISQTGYELLKQLGISVDPVLYSDDICIDCYQNVKQRIISNAEHQKNVKMVFDALSIRNSKTHDPVQPGYFISKSWLNDWKKGITFVAPNIGNYKKDVWCAHGALSIHSSRRTLISSKSHEILQHIFPDMKCCLGNDTECVLCIENHEQDSLEHRPLRIRANFEANTLKRLLDKKKLQLEINHDYFLVPTSFLTMWRSFVKSRNHSLPPTSLDINSVLCQAHGNLLFDLETDNTKETVLSFVSTDEWKVIQEIYILADKKAIHVRLVVDDADIPSKNVHFEVDPPTCWECRKQRILSFDKTDIHIVKFATPIDTDFQVDHKGLESEDGKNSSDATISKSDVLLLDSKRPLSKSPEPKPNLPTKKRRVSKRIRSERSVVACITPTMTAHELKFKLMNHFHTPPMYQQLFYRDKELVQDEMTMREIGIGPGETIEIRIFEQPEHPTFQDHASTSTESGFSGTALAGIMPGLASTQTQKTSSEHRNCESWTCFKCTFINPSTTKECSMCGPINT
ncbi:hypothetical protein QVD99_006373 [Batrachochytrium dendrobatidis]|nr:hypothetical protein QVD99_006373 [Batrachochytrium dendrobatidis]